MLESLLTQAHAEERNETALLIADIRTDGGTQPRAGIDLDVVAEYADVYLADPLRMPPVAVTYDGATYWLTDGFHRLEAAKTADLARIRAVVEPGTQADAQWRSYAANATHGLRRTNADKERAIRAALRHPNAAEMSNSVLAAHLGVTDKSVAKYRQQMERTSEIPKSATRTGADGRTINTANIGPKPSPAPATNPDRLPDWATILATPDEVADAIDIHMQWSQYRDKYSYLLNAKKPGPERRNIAGMLSRHHLELVDDYDGDLLLDGIRTLLQRTMQAEIDRIDAEEAHNRKPTPTPVDLDAPTSEFPKSAPPADTQPSAYTPLDKTAINLALDAMNTAKRHVATYQQIAGFQPAHDLRHHLEAAVVALYRYDIDRIVRKNKQVAAEIQWRDGWDDADQAHYDDIGARSVWLAGDITRRRVAARMAAEIDDADLRTCLEKRMEELA